MILTAVKHHKKNLRADWNNWCALVETIMAQKRVAT
jgi:hypothetical protein